MYEISVRGKQVKTPTCYLLKFGCMCTFCGVIVFEMIIMFSVNVVNTKVVGNFIIYLVLNFHDHNPDGLGAIDFSSSLSGFACSLCRSE